MLKIWREFFGGYRDNPVALRDFRVQFRNGRVVALMLAFCLLSTLIAFLAYAGAVGSNSGGITSVQAALSGTYQSVMFTLYVLVVALSAFSAAFSVVAERQRKALDLVFCSPFSPRRYVLGKVVAGARYSVLLVALAFPAMATMVVAGGATAEDVLLHAVLLALNAITFTCVAVAFAGIARSFLLPFGGLIAVGFLWTLIIAPIAWAGIGAGSFMGASSGSSTLPFASALLQATPFIGFATPSASVDFFGHLVPSWAVAASALLLMGRLAVVAGVAALEYPPVLADVNLRLHGLGLILMLGFVTAFALPDAAPTFNALVSSVMPVALISVLLSLSAFFTAAFGPEREQIPPARTAFDFKRTLRAHSDGALFYGLLIMVAWWLPFLVVRPYFLQAPSLILIVHTLTLMALIVLLLRLGSVWFRTAANARMVTVVTCAILVVIGSIALTTETIPSIMRPFGLTKESDAPMLIVDVGLTLAATVFGYVFLERNYGHR